MGAVTYASNFLRAPKQVVLEINQESSLIKGRLLVGMLFLSAAYGALFPALKMGLREETLQFVLKDALVFPAIFLITYFVLVLPLNLFLGEAEKSSALLALWLNGALVITLTFLPLLIVSTLKNSANVVTLNGALVTLATLFCALQVNACLNEMRPNSSTANWALTLLFAALILWTLLNVQNLFVLSADWGIPVPMYLEGAAKGAIVTPQGVR